MSCLSKVWCPQCEQIITDDICMCTLYCEIHGRVCTSVIPNGCHFVRDNKHKFPHTKAEYKNGWEVGCYGWPPGRDWNYLPAIWITKEPGHPTKTPFEIEREQRMQQEMIDAKRWFKKQIDDRDQLNCNSGGSI